MLKQKTKKSVHTEFQKKRTGKMEKNKCKTLSKKTVM